MGVVQKFSDPKSCAEGIRKTFKWKDLHKNKLGVTMSTAAKRYSYEEEQNSLMKTYSDLLNLSKTN